MQVRKDKLVSGQYYHVFSRSIAKFVIFNNDVEYLRMLDIIKLYRHVNFDNKYSKFIKLNIKTKKSIINNLEKDNLHLTEIVAFCLMPTHFHLLIKQVEDQGISKYMAKILNCYSRFFNVKHKRTGPLWSGRFKSVLVSNDSQLLHLSRYIHLNPTSTNLTENPEDWVYSSYREYLETNSKKRFCSYKKLFDFSSKEYEKFCLDRRSYQKELTQIKNLLIDNYTG